MSLKDHPTVKNFFKKEETASAHDLSTPVDSKWLKGLAIESGADDVGLVDIGRPGLAVQKEEILELFPKTNTLMSIICKINPENIRCVSRAVSDTEYLQGFDMVNTVSRKIARALREKGIISLSPSAGFPMDMDKWPGKMWPLSHKPVAIEAGLGQMGHHRLVIHPQFGSFVLLGTLLLDCEVSFYDEPIDFNPCVECKFCVTVCPVGAVGRDGRFNFANCMTHNYRDRMGGFVDWTEKVASSKGIHKYRKKVSDPETVSMWQSLSYGICNKSSYCMAACPAGEEVIGPFLKDRKSYTASVVKPLQKKTENIYVVPGSDAEAYVAKRFPHKTIKRVSNGLRPKSAKNFLESLPLVFQRDQSGGLNATYHFTFNGSEQLDATVVIRDQNIEVHEGLVGVPDLHVKADSMTWVRFLAKEQNLISALLRRKIRIKGPPRLMKAFASCFPS